MTAKVSKGIIPIDETRHEVVSRPDHFTVMVNAVLTPAGEPPTPTQGRHGWLGLG